MNASIRRAAGALVLIASLGVLRAAPATGTPITIDDLLHRESLSDVWFSPDGESLVLQIEAGAADQPRSEYFASWINGQQLLLVNPRTNARHPLRSPDAELSLTLLRQTPWSPDGEALMLLASRGGHYHIAYWDRARDEVRVLPGRPRSASLPDVVWAGRKLAYASLPDDAPQSWSKVQRLEFLAKQWRQAWTREGVPPTISSASEVFRTSEPSAGLLYLADTVTGRSEVLARGDFSSIAVSADGRWLSAVRQTKVIVEALADSGRQGEMVVFDLAGPKPRLVATVTDWDIHPENGVWSSAGGQLLFGAKRPEGKREALRMFQLDGHSGRITPIPTAGLRLALPFYGAAPRMMPFGWIDGQPAAIAGTVRSAAGASEADSYGREGRLRYDLYLFGTGEARNLTETARQGVRTFVNDSQGGGLIIVDGALCRANAGGLNPIFTPEAGTRLTGFFLPGRNERYANDFSYFAGDGEERIAVQVARENAPATFAVLDLVRGRFALTPSTEVISFSPDLQHVLTREIDRWAESFVYDGRMDFPLASVNLAMKSRAIAPLHAFTYEAAGATRQGWYLLPPQADMTKPQPAVVWIYGGHLETARPPDGAATRGRVEPMGSGQLLAAAGYVVIYASYPLKPGKESNLMADLATQAVAAIDQLARDHVVDPQRVAIMGHSFGGFSTAAVLTQRSDRFRAGIASAGIYDPISIYGSQSMGDLIVPDGRLSNSSVTGAETGQLGLMDPPWVNPDAYMRNSPFFHVDKLDTPLLILATDLDGSARFYQALIRAGKHPVLVRSWAESHVPVAAASMRSRWEAISSWLAHHLKEIVRGQAVH